jgi:hypothetical protein
MGSRGAYAGQPHAFYCSKCRRSPGFTKRVVLNGRHETLGGYAGNSWRTTGRTRAQGSQGANQHRWGQVAYQYECLECGHVGWSRHPWVAGRHQREHGNA